MGPGRLICLALALVLVAVAPSLARTQKRHVTVVRGHGFSLTAWDHGKSLCLRLKSAGKSSAKCTSSPGLAYTSLRGTTETVLGGPVRRGAATVVATFSDGRELTMKTKRGSRYKGRRHVRFWAGRHAGSAVLRSLAAKSARGATLQVMDVSPQPPPPNPPGPCGCGGPPLARVMCPLTPCPE